MTKIMNTWQAPKGQMILINSLQELITFINKIGFSIDQIDLLESFGIKLKMRQMTEKELNDAGLSYDQDYEEDTLVPTCKTILCKKNNLPIFDSEFDFFDEPTEISDRLSHISISETEIMEVTEDDIEELVENYQFPCVIYINIDKIFDRTGEVKVQMWFVESLNTMSNVKSCLSLEEKYASTWTENYKKALENQRKRK